MLQRTSLQISLYHTNNNKVKQDERQQPDSILVALTIISIKRGQTSAFLKHLLLLASVTTCFPPAPTTTSQLLFQQSFIHK